MGETALFQAVEMNNINQVNTLLAFKANPNDCQNVKLNFKF